MVVALQVPFFYTHFITWSSGIYLILLTFSIAVHIEWTENCDDDIDASGSTESFGQSECSWVVKLANSALSFVRLATGIMLALHLFKRSVFSSDHLGRLNIVVLQMFVWMICTSIIGLQEIGLRLSDPIGVHATFWTDNNLDASLSSLTFPCKFNCRKRCHRPSRHFLHHNNTREHSIHNQSAEAKSHSTRCADRATCELLSLS